ncbi:unnamed protein product [Effrenium voratum]|uniref:Uncharacterized protein n=1 Tax=Effrenium voratum TaxID=2562239 RepID=A0AA36HWI1_9DINO|nr:unnamed protein product [Effrenium voratum]
MPRAAVSAAEKSAAKHCLGSLGSSLPSLSPELLPCQASCRSACNVLRHCTHSDLVMPGGRGSAQDTDLESYGSAVVSRRLVKANAVSPTTYALACIAVVCHVLLIVVISWTSCSFAHWEDLDEPTREPIQWRIVTSTHAELGRCWSPALLMQKLASVEAPTMVSPFCEMRVSTLTMNRLRNFMSLMLGPMVTIQTVLHWFQGTHFPLTASKSFYIVSTGRELDPKVPKVNLGMIFCTAAMAIFFFYGGMWNIALLYMRTHDLEPGFEFQQCFAQLMVCCMCMMTKLKPAIMFFVSYLVYRCITMYVNPLMLAFIPTVLFLVAAVSPTGRRGAPEGQDLLPTVRGIIHDFALFAYEQT